MNENRDALKMDERGAQARDRLKSIANDPSVEGSEVFKDLYIKMDFDTLFRGSHEEREKFITDMQREMLIAGSGFLAKEFFSPWLQGIDQAFFLLDTNRDGLVTVNELKVWKNKFPLFFDNLIEYDSSFQDFKLKINELVSDGSTLGVNEQKLLFSFFIENLERMVLTILKTMASRFVEEFCRIEEEMLQRNKNALKLHATQTLPHEHENLRALEQKLHEDISELSRQFSEEDQSSSTRFDTSKLKNIANNQADQLAKSQEDKLTHLEQDAVTMLDSATTQVSSAIQMAKMLMPNANVQEIYENILDGFGLKADFKSMEVIRKVRTVREEFHQGICSDKLNSYMQQLPELINIVTETTRNYFKDSYKSESNDLRNPVKMEQPERWTGHKRDL